MNTFVTMGVLAGAMVGASGCAADDGRIRALIVTGHNNHNWRYTSQMHKNTLEASGRFIVDVTDVPASALADAKSLAKYQVVVLDYNDSQEARRWGQPAEGNFVSAVREGLGVVSVHSANNAFKGWTEYEQMIGPMWREGTGHGPFHTFDIESIDTSHAILAGLPPKSSTTDELYHKLVNTHKSDFRLLAQAMSAKDKGGTGENEPMAMTLAYGKGRVFHTPLGHVWVKSEESKVSVGTPIFRTLLVRGTEWAATGSVTLGAEWKDIRLHNALSEAETKDGWTLLFDGKTAAMRGWKKAGGKLPARWKIEDGALRLLKGEGEGGDICTNDEFGDFEFECDWKVAPGGNSGVMYRATEDHNYPWETGPEMQILDNARHQDGKKEKTAAGSLYDVKECAFDVARPAGEWNTSRVVCKGTHIEHWLNGYRVVEIDLLSEDYKARHAASKWPGMKDYATRPSGHIALQDHGDEVWFRNIKVRRAGK